MTCNESMGAASQRCPLPWAVPSPTDLNLTSLRPLQSQRQRKLQSPRQSQLRRPPPPPAAAAEEEEEEEFDTSNMDRR